MGIVGLYYIVLYFGNVNYAKGNVESERGTGVGSQKGEKETDRERRGEKGVWDRRSVG